MNNKEKTIDHLLGALAPEEKAGQLLVFGFNGTIIDSELEDLVDRFNLGGLRTSPYIRKFIRYLPDGAPGIQNVLRPPRLYEKLWEEHLKTPTLRASEYAALLNRLRRRAMDRKHPIPLHFAIDCESGAGCNYLPPGFLTFPSAMGFGYANSVSLVRETYYAVGRQLKAIGFDHVHGPVVDVNTNPRNPEISTRSFSSDPAVVTRCARAALQGFKAAGVIATLKHYPGRGASGEDAHFGLSSIPLDREAFYREHLAPYLTLCAEKIVPAVMPAHSLYPTLDPANEIATVSKAILTGILREELGFDGIITTDSITMGGIMAKYSVGEAVVKAIAAGADIVLLKDDNSLRYEAHAVLTEAIREGVLSEDRVNQSLRRIWSTKWDYGLFKNGGVVKTAGLDDYLFRQDFQAADKKAAGQCIQLLRDRAGILPLRKEQKLLIIDRVSPDQFYANDSWNHPAMFWEFIQEQTRRATYIDYQPKTIQAVQPVIEQIAPQVDVLVVTALYDRNVHEDSKPFIAGLKRFGKPVVLISNNPYELAVPPEIDTVIVTYSLLHASLQAVSRYLFRSNARRSRKA